MKAFIYCWGSELLIGSAILISVFGIRSCVYRDENVDALKACVGAYVTGDFVKERVEQCQKMFEEIQK